MKTLRDYIAERKRVYTYQVKVAGDVPEHFQKCLEQSLESKNLIEFKKQFTTPVQKHPLDFPEISNKEVHVFEVQTGYPVSEVDLQTYVRESGIPDEYFRIRNSVTGNEKCALDPTRILNPNGLLTDSLYKESENVPSKKLAGEAYNQSLLKELAAAAKTRDRTEGHGSLKKVKQSPAKQDAAGKFSAIGSKK